MYFVHCTVCRFAFYDILFFQLLYFKPCQTYMSPRQIMDSPTPSPASRVEGGATVLPTKNENPWCSFVNLSCFFGFFSSTFLSTFNEIKNGTRGKLGTGGGARIFKHFRNPGIDSASLCCLAVRYNK